MILVQFPAGDRTINGCRVKEEINGYKKERVSEYKEKRKYIERQKLEMSKK